MATIDVVQFEISGTNYAIDIKTAREIVEMMPITPVPRSPSHIAGIINLRGEITNVMNLNCLMGLESAKDHMSKKIIVLVPEATGGSNIGLIVDDVQSVLQINEDNIDQMDASLSKEAFVKGIIKADAAAKEKKDLVIWIDIEKILEETLGGRQECVC
ncbi:MAG: chemotaxis protein CheW [Methanomicrobium sp.]|nr:chemotaxis protein CheW [Methanomicrobium sp.]MDD4299696.1 chemotaxis protein CheW [Methanomicrobium sp.]